MKDISNSDIIEYMLKNNATTRETAIHFGVSRQTISNRVEQSKNKKAKELLKGHFNYKSKWKFINESEIIEMEDVQKLLDKFKENSGTMLKELEKGNRIIIKKNKESFAIYSELIKKIK